MALTIPSPHDEIILLLSQGASPEEIIRYKPSAALQERMSLLLSWSKERPLSEVEKAELDHYLVLEHIMRLAKIHARRRRNKGADVGTVLLPGNNFVRFFNPRLDKWEEHFSLNDGQIQALTLIGAATIKILDFNHFERIIERRALIKDGRYPRR